MSHLMQNLNSNLLAAVDIITTGTNPFCHDLIQITVIPLTSDITPARRPLPFHLTLKLKRPDEVDYSYCVFNKSRILDCQIKGMDPYTGAELFVDWFEKLNLPNTKRIMPLGFNFISVAPFIREWLGGKTYDICFHEQFRDVQTVATFCNDVAGWIGQDFPYPKIDFTYITSTLRVEKGLISSRDTIDTARAIAEVYRCQVQRHII